MLGFIAGESRGKAEDLEDEYQDSDVLRASAAHRSRAIAGPIVAMLGGLVVGYMSFIGYLGQVDLILNVILLGGLALCNNIHHKGLT